MAVTLLICHLMLVSALFTPIRAVMVPCVAALRASMLSSPYCSTALA